MKFLFVAGLVLLLAACEDLATSPTPPTNKPVGASGELGKPKPERK